MDHVPLSLIEIEKQLFAVELCSESGRVCLHDYNAYTIYKNRLFLNKGHKLYYEPGGMNASWSKCVYQLVVDSIP